MKVDHILKLARIEIGKKEKAGLEKEFSAVLNFVKKIEEIKVAETKLAASEEDIKNVMREDQKQKVENKLPLAKARGIPPAEKFVSRFHPRDKSRGIPAQNKKQKAEKLLDLAPETKDGYIKTKQIL